MVNTTAGPIDPEDLGVTYMHEHVFIVNPEMQHCWPGYQSWDEEAAVERARAVLRSLHEEHGVDSILDPTVAGLGRHVRAVARAAEGSGVNVVVATGWYVYAGLPITFFAKDLARKTDELERLFVRDAEEGLEGTSIKPGVIKCYTDVAGVTTDVEAVLRASARTHLRTGLPITTHSAHSNESGLMQQRIFSEEGVDMEAVVIGHCNQSPDLGYLERLLENGTYIGFDRCGLSAEGDAPLDEQLDNLAELCRRGYAKRIVLSHDKWVFFDAEPAGALEGAEHFPYGVIEAMTLPGLRQRGVTDEQVDDMLVAAPRAYFSRGGS